MRRYILLAMVFVFCGSIAAYSAPYTDSAHGDQNEGVERSDMPDVYATGNCAHCHLQHGSVEGSDGTAYGYALFSTNFSGKSTSEYYQSDNVCFQCHTASSSKQEGGVLLNADYAETFGGYDEGTSEGIFEQFNHTSDIGSSYHNLKDIQSYAAANFESWFTPDSNPCVACHNPHRAKRNKSDVKDPSLTAISLPSEHENLWGDDSGETMGVYSVYQAPYHYGSGYEPGGLTGSDPTKVPDYSTFCNDCHDVNMPTIASTSLGRDLLMVNWSSTGTDSAPYGDKHGGVGRTGTTWLREPYLTAGMSKTNFVLSCLDCHEPHGSPYPFLMRRSINGQPLNLTDHSMEADGRGFQCLQCHQDDSQLYSDDYSTTNNKGETDNPTEGGWENDWREQHHGLGNDSPYSANDVNNCGCHYPDFPDTGIGRDGSASPPYTL